jgi:hypothetical protein
VRLPLARLVVEEHLADATLVAETEAHARRTGEPLVAALVTVAQVDEALLARAISRRLGLPLLETLEPDGDALRELEHDLARRHRVLLLGFDLAGDGRRRARVAMADPTDAAALAMLEDAVDGTIEPVLASLATVEDAITRAYRGFVTEVIHRVETVPAPGPVAPPRPREPFGANLSEISTQPFHQIEGEAPLELRLRMARTDPAAVAAARVSYISGAVPNPRER